ncbi:MAG: hypothetical protein OQL08_10425 [Gammaproteobacteria bacterium]|nr:hypothetical protein [Gammaproteobacteria bacterium]
MPMQIVIAARGWQGPEWDHFYPLDLPAEWRLAYYANEFFAVVVPYQEWAAAGDEALLAWLREVKAEFRFYWELPLRDAAARARLQRLRETAEFAAHWGGVVDDVAFRSLSESPFSQQRLALLWLLEPLALRPLGQAMQGAVTSARQEGADSLLLVVAAPAAASLRPARDLAWLLAGGAGGG